MEYVKRLVFSCQSSAFTCQRLSACAAAAPMGSASEGVVLQRRRSSIREPQPSLALPCRSPPSRSVVRLSSIAFETSSPWSISSSAVRLGGEHHAGPLPGVATFTHATRCRWGLAWRVGARPGGSGLGRPPRREGLRAGFENRLCPSHTLALAKFRGRPCGSAHESSQSPIWIPSRLGFVSARHRARWRPSVASSDGRPRLRWCAVQTQPEALSERLNVLPSLASS
jgi:hypothetical protein